MTFYGPENAIAACHEAMDRGRQMVLDDLKAHPTRSAEHYALLAASYVHAILMPNARADLLARLADNATMAGRSDATAGAFADHKRQLEEMRDALCMERSVWACEMMDLAVGIARAADELFRADNDPRGWLPKSATAFVFRFVYPMPEHTYVGLTTPAVRASSTPTVDAAQAFAVTTDEVVMAAKAAVSPPSNPAASLSTPVEAMEMLPTMDAFVEQWLDAKGVSSRAERSRQGSSARLFVEAMGLSVSPSNQLTEIGDNAAQQFVAYARATPLKARGERARIAHVKNFIDYARGVYDAVPELDWVNVRY